MTVYLVTKKANELGAFTVVGVFADAAMAEHLRYELNRKYDKPLYDFMVKEVNLEKYEEVDRAS